MLVRDDADLFGLLSGSFPRFQNPGPLGDDHLLSSLGLGTDLYHRYHAF